MKKLVIIVLIILSATICHAYCDISMNKLCSYNNVAECKAHCGDECNDNMDDFPSFLACPDLCDSYNIKYENCFGDTKYCPATTALGDDTQTLQALRDLRYNTMSKTAAGRAIIDLYYKIAPEVDSLMRASPTLRIWCATILRQCNKFATKTK